MHLLPVAIFLLLLTASFRGENCTAFSATACYEFDTVTAGVVVEGEIPFTNTGEEPKGFVNATKSASVFGH